MSVANEIYKEYRMGGCKAKRLLIGVDAACELKKSKQMLNYGHVTPTEIKFLGMVVSEDSSLPKNTWILK